MPDVVTVSNTNERGADQRRKPIRTAPGMCAHIVSPQNVTMELSGLIATHWHLNCLQISYNSGERVDSIVRCLISYLV